MKNICYIIGASYVDDIILKTSNNDFVIAADGGYTKLKKLSSNADLIVGDFDSLDVVPKQSNIIRFPKEKDDTDMMIAVKEGLERDYKKFVLLGGLGGRLDHTIANIQILAYLANYNAVGYLLGDNQVITAIRNRKLHFDKDKKGIISVFCSGDIAKGVNLTGLKYQLNDAELTCNLPLGISNEFIGLDSTVEVKDGTLIIMWSQGSSDFLRKLPH